jgi:pilus assembly protein Flp/PilA
MRKTTSLVDAPISRAVAFTVTVLGLIDARLDERRDRGATAVEYGLMVGLIAVVIIVAVTALGGRLTGMFQSVTTALTPAAPAAG